MLLCSHKVTHLHDITPSSPENLLHQILFCPLSHIPGIVKKNSKTTGKPWRREMQVHGVV